MTKKKKNLETEAPPAPEPSPPPPPESEPEMCSECGSHAVTVKLCEGCKDEMLEAHGENMLASAADDFPDDDDGDGASAAKLIREWTLVQKTRGNIAGAVAGVLEQCAADLEVGHP
jgi:hypothetical protein